MKCEPQNVDFCLSVIAHGRKRFYRREKAIIVFSQAQKNMESPDKDAGITFRQHRNCFLSKHYIPFFILLGPKNLRCIQLPGVSS